MSGTTTPERKPVGGVDYPRNWHEFLEFFSTDERCLRYLARLRWPDAFRCPRRAEPTTPTLDATPRRLDDAAAERPVSLRDSGLRLVR